MSDNQLKIKVVDAQFFFGSLGLFKGSWLLQTASGLPRIFIGDTYINCVCVCVFIIVIGIKLSVVFGVNNNKFILIHYMTHIFTCCFMPLCLPSGLGYLHQLQVYQDARGPYWDCSCYLCLCQQTL